MMPNLRNDSKWALVLVCLALVLGVTLPGEASGASADTRHEWVFVDTTVAGYQDLVDDVLAGGDDGRQIELVLLDGRRDGLEQIAQALAGRSGTDAIHLITHGSQAELQLGTARLTTDSMTGAYADTLSEIGLALAEGGDILVYGCHFGQGALGRQAASRLAVLSGADIAASDDLTGAQGLGGDWELEYLVGNVETAVAFSTQLQENWSGLLATTVVSNAPVGFFDNTQDLIHFDGTTFYLFYEKNDGNIYWKSSSDNVTWSSEQILSPSGREAGVGWDIWWEDDTTGVLVVGDSTIGDGQLTLHKISISAGPSIALSGAETLRRSSWAATAPRPLTGWWNIATVGCPSEALTRAGFLAGNAPLDDEGLSPIAARPARCQTS